MAMIGMDLDAATAAAHRLQQLAQQLQSLAGATNSAVNGLASTWRGADSLAFVGTQWPTHLTTMKQAQADLEQLAGDVLANVQEQQQASGAFSVGGGAVGAAPLATAVQDPAAYPDGLVDRFGDAASRISASSDMVEISKEIGGLHFPAWIEGATKAVPYLGAMATGATVGADIAHGDTPAAVIDTGLGLFSLVPGAGPGVDAAQGFLKVTTPYTSDSQDALIDYALREKFGSGVTEANMTSDQSAWLTDHYDSPLGVMNMISDSMAKFASETTTPVIQSGVDTASMAAQATANGAGELLKGVASWLRL